MLAKTLMVQGTGSHVGKSVIVAALCRIFTQDGYRVAPFKAQNMALNSFVTREGLEIGRAQAVQAQAARTEPTVEMNPILLKPQADSVAQVVVLGKPLSNMEASKYHSFKPALLEIVADSLQKLRAEFDLVVIEGAGSPAEINLQEKDIANMKIAELAGAPVILAGDIDKGGVFASLVGTLELLEASDKERIAGFIINKFRGDIKLLEPGLQFLEEKTRIPVLGVIPYYRNIWIEEEDSIPLESRHSTMPERAEIEIAIIYLPHISNFTDFDALEREGGVRVSYVSSDKQVKEPDVVIIPGSKSTSSDLNYLYQSGLAAKILALAARKVPVIGICGGYQMLGKVISDPDQIESECGEIAGLGLLEVETIFSHPDKITSQVEAEVISTIQGNSAKTKVTGYEIHMGTSKFVGEVKPAFRIFQRCNQPIEIEDGAASKDGLVFGTYIHGLFDNDEFRKNFVNFLRQRKGLPALSVESMGSAQRFKEEQFDRLAGVVRQSLDLELIYKIIGLKSRAYY